MMFAVFCLAAAAVYLLSGLAARLAPADEPHKYVSLKLDGMAFVGGVLLACLGGLYISRDASAVALWQPAGLAVIVLTGVLYVLSALRSRLKWAPFLSDLLILLATGGAIYFFNTQAFTGIRLPHTNQFENLGVLSVPFTMGFVWLITRMTAALNRTPHVTGGYLGLVGLTFCILGYQQRAPLFPLICSAALAGAGLVSIPLGLQRSNWNIGWSAALAMGFLLAQSAVLGLWKNFAFTILALMVLVLGVPLLDVSFYRLRAARRGASVNWQKKHLRLHEALAARGFSRAKVSSLYLALAAWLCALGVITVITAPLNFFLRAAILATLLFSGATFFFSVIRVLMRRLEDEEMPEDVEAFGVRISPVSMTEAMDKIEAMIKDGTPHHVVTSDANAILRAQEDEEYAGILQRAALVTPDGYGVMWGARLLNLPIYERVTGVDMVTGICARAAKHGYRIFILGSEPGIASTAAQKLSETYPGLNVVGTHHGMILRDEELKKHALQQVKDAKPDVLFVAMGIPLQEKFIANHMAELGVPVSLGVGGSFDVYSEKLQRAPEAVQRAGLEWLYRVWQEPWRWRRMSYVPRFMIFAIKEWLGITNITRDQRRKRQA